MRKPRISAPIRQKALCCSGVSTWRTQCWGITLILSGTHTEFGHAADTRTRLNLARGLPRAREGPIRRAGDWTEGGLDFTGLGKPGERKRFFLSRSHKMQGVRKNVHPFMIKQIVCPSPEAVLVTHIHTYSTLNCDSGSYCPLNKYSKYIKSEIIKLYISHEVNGKFTSTGPR